MQFNLIDEKWLPVRRRDGVKEMIAPWEVTDKFTENPVVALNAPRPDFNGALIQFLIGLVQTVAAPARGSEWRKKLEEPPSPLELKAAFATVHHAFELGGDGPRFMQDFDALDGKERSIAGLLIEEPGENTLKNNIDFFAKRKKFNFLMCPACCAAALLSLQTNAPAGGRGYMTSLRGGGPLTTVVQCPDLKRYSLWHSIWLNVLESKKFHGLANVALDDSCEKFPWLAKHKVIVSEQQMHPAQYFWAMPRRTKLNLPSVQSGKCDVCGIESDKLISQYVEVPNGTKYQEPMKHPLSPFNGNSTKSLLTQEGGIGYRHWIGLVTIDKENKNEPARVVHEFIQERQKSEWQFRIHAFGYDFVPKQKKARCWYESTMPLHYIDISIKDAYEHCVANVVKAAVFVVENLRIALKNSMHGKPKFDPLTKKIKWEYRDIKKLPSDEDERRAKILYKTKDKTALMSAESFFWQNTEPLFFVLLHGVRESLEAGIDYLKHLKNWHEKLCCEAERLFGIYALEGVLEDSDPKRIVLARSEMMQFNRSKRIRDLLGL